MTVEQFQKILEQKNFLSSKVDFTYLRSLRFWSIFHRSEKKMKFSTSNVLKKFSRCPMNMFKVSTMSAYIRAFQRTNSRDHTTHRDKMVQEKQKTGTWDTFWISLLYMNFLPFFYISVKRNPLRRVLREFLNKNSYGISKFKKSRYSFKRDIFWKSTQNNKIAQKVHFFMRNLCRKFVKMDNHE